jgi:hypothetical protein
VDFVDAWEMKLQYPRDILLRPHQSEISNKENKRDLTK